MSQRCGWLQSTLAIHLLFGGHVLKRKRDMLSLPATRVWLDNIEQASGHSGERHDRRATKTAQRQHLSLLKGEHIITPPWPARRCMHGWHTIARILVSACSARCAALSR